MGLNVQGYGIVNDAYKETVGDKLSGSLDTKDLVSMGKDLEDLDLFDKFYGKITNKIAKTLAYVMSYEAENRNVLADNISFGAFIEKIYIDSLDAVADPSWLVSQSQGTMSNVASPYDVTAVHTITTKIYGSSIVWSYEFNTDIHQLRNAFRSEANMVAFIDGIFVKANTDMELEKEAIVTASINTGVECAVVGGCVRNVLQRYNDQATTPITKAQTMTNSDFLKWSNKYINHDIRLMKKPTRRYNPARYLNRCDDPEIEVLSLYAEASKVYLESGTYHDDKVALGGNYREVDFWQFNTEDFDGASAISISNVDIWNDGQSTPSAIAFTTNGIFAIARDPEAVKSQFSLDYQWSMPNPRARINTYGYDFNKGFAVEPHANFMVYGMWDIDKTNVANGTTLTIKGDVASGNTIELTGTSVAKYYYKVDNDANFTEVTANSDGKYILTVPSFTDKIYFKTTKTS